MLIWDEIENIDFMNDKVQLIREPDQQKQTLGKMLFQGKEIAKTVELPWLNNASKKSCIPPGTYKVIRRRSDKHGDHFHITNVPGRSLILIHAANYSAQLLGCVGPGDKHVDINKDGLKDVTNSKATMATLLKILPQSFNLEII